MDDDDRSSDGSDSAGSLVDFLVDDSDAEALVETEDEESEAQALVKEFPFDKRLLEEDSSVGPRRSKRQRKAVQRYQDPEFLKLMLEDVDEDGLSDDEDDKTLHAEEDDSDGDFNEGDLADSESDESEEEED